MVLLPPQTFAEIPLPQLVTLSLSLDSGGGRRRDPFAPGPGERYGPLITSPAQYRAFAERQREKKKRRGA